MNKTAQNVLDEKTLDSIISRHHGLPGEILGIIEEVQDLHKYKYLPEETLEYIADKSSISLAQIYSVVTFYSFFNLIPQGEHSILICRGTACHTRGSTAILESLNSFLDLTALEEDESILVTAKDNKFTVRMVACIGQCALAPAVVIDGKVYSHMTHEKLKVLIESINQKSDKK